MTIRAGVLTDTLPPVLFGGDYNPEQWPEEVWTEDVRLMKQAGVNMVSLAVFAWAKLEPVEGQYEFGWLDRVLDLLHQAGIRVNLATATASPPAWMALDYPETLPVRRDGVVLGFGSRQQYSPSSAVYRDRAARLVRRLAERYRDHPALAMWHINNEYGCHIWECFSPHTALAFRRWLQQRYHHLDELNRVWGTAFWSQTYGTWAQIQPPGAMPGLHNPTQLLDWRRFSSAMIEECLCLEAAILREITPHIPLNTNFLGVSKEVDQRALARHEDVVSSDIYPDPASPDAPHTTALQADWARSLKDGQPWIVMEQAASQVQWRAVNRPKQPGQMRALSYSMVARGARGLLYFQWRQSRSGAEKYHSGMLPHTGTASRIWREVEQLGQELAALSTLSFCPQAQVALLVDWDAWQVLEHESQPHSGLRLMAQVDQLYQALWRKNILVDFVTSRSDLSRYRAVIAPSLPSLTEESALRLRAYVAQGGHLVMSYFSGVTDEHDHIHAGTEQGSYNPLLRDLLGIRIEDFDPQLPDAPVELSNGWQAGDWCDVLALEGAQALAHHRQGPLRGRPAVTRHRSGQGLAYHLGTQLRPAALSAFLALVLDAARVSSPLSTPEGVETVVWTDGTTFVINHSAEVRDIALPRPMANLLERGQPSAALRLRSFEVALLVPHPEPQLSVR